MKLMLDMASCIQLVKFIVNSSVRMRQSIYEEDVNVTPLKCEKTEEKKGGLINSRPVAVISSTVSQTVVKIAPNQIQSQTPRSYDSMSLDDLEIIKTIGTGTFGRVTLCQETESGEYGALKILSLYDVIRLKQIEHVKNEKNILMAVEHPFIVRLKWHFKDEYNIYFLLDYACGGELFSYLRKAGKFSPSTCSFYTAEIVSALEYLHGKSIAHRDLKPENLLLDKEGHLKITDFGFAKRMRDKTWTLCGTPEYLAPEIIQSKGYTKAVDWWALGVLIYEMSAGYSPFYDDNKFTTYEKILSGKVEWPKVMDTVTKDLIRKLLVQDRSKRLGSIKNGADEVKRHKYFREYDWDDVFQRKLTPPIIPKVFFDGDTRCFDTYSDSWRMKSVTDEELELFDDF